VLLDLRLYIYLVFLSEQWKLGVPGDDWGGAGLGSILPYGWFNKEDEKKRERERERERKDK